MKTFDLAIKHLDASGIDFSAVPPFVVGDEGHIDVEATMNKYLADKRNTHSNDYYRRVTFGAAMIHKIFQAHKIESFVSVAEKIIEKHSTVLNTKFELYLRTAYPKVMVDDWIDYCDSIKDKINLLEGELREEWFMLVFHYKCSLVS